MNKLFYLTLLFFLPHLGFAQEVYIVQDQKEPVRIGGKFNFFLDESNKLTIEEVLKRNEFKSLHNDVARFETDATVWGQIKLIGTGEQITYLSIDPPTTNELSIIQKSSDGKWIEKKEGHTIANEIKTFAINHFIYKLNLHKGDTSLILLKMQYNLPTILDIRVGTLESYIVPFHQLDFFNCICFGILIMMLLYNLYLCIAQREIEYLWYVLYLFFSIIILSRTLGYTPHFPYLIAKMNELAPSLAFNAPLIFLLLFTMELFKGLLPKWLIRFNYFFMFVSFISIVAGCIGYEYFASKIVLMQGPLLIFPCIAAGVIALTKKHTSAVYYLIGYGVFLTGFACLILTFTGQLSLDLMEAFKAHTFGTSFECVLLSFALGNKLKVSQNEKEKAQQESLFQATENERLVKEQNNLLEQKVNQRTFQLNEANNELTTQRDEIKHQKHLVEEHQREMVDSITYAKRIQDAILPPINLIKDKLPNTFVLYKPKDIVAGDFYWMEEIDNTIFIAAADCTGHGVPGAMVSVVCSNALNRAVKEFDLRETGKILDKVTDLVIETFEKSAAEVKDGMDISLLSINKVTQQINWSGANNPLWYFEDKILKEITADKQPIGKSDYRKPFTTNSIEYKPNTTFYLFTDGYADQFGGPKGKKFMYKPLKEILFSILEKKPSDQQQTLDLIFENWKNNLEQVDDVCIIGVRV